MRQTIRFSVAAVAIAVLVLWTVTPAAAWAWHAHRTTTEAVAGDRCGLSGDNLDEVKKESVWPDKPAAKDGEGTIGIDEEIQPWYQDWADYLGIPGDSGQLLSVFNYENGLWPVGKAHENAAEFMQNGKDYVSNGYVAFGMDKLGKGSHFMQDMGVVYHTSLLSNVDGVTDLDGYTFNHKQYEQWADDNVGNHGFDDWAGYGAYYSDRVDVNSKSDIKETTADLAADANGRIDKIDGEDWQDNIWATQYNFWDTGQHTAAVYEYAAPGYFDC